ncbi:rod shape-determining protein MreD [Acinetobacter ursingii]|uniref:rod shape-determining protein MreD n=1 Tax=Acinetobacter ursingii TaxID=108980 RepID=UPI0021D21727|nr:rod shape-determining protein MreD [Acinetobacter ursingii]MCU4359506.1 rod shape-determining protein MreD [Acinetobacter ursingii]MEC8056876.1 rod shape-determining protein MreD [Pseudomonadota bacterium]
MPIAKLKYEKRKDPLIIIIISIIISSILMIYPLSYEVSGWRPLVMLMVMLFWVLCQPTWCGVWFAFATGLFTDLLIDSPLGLNALSFVLITFIVRYFTRERRILTFMNLWTIVILALIAHLFFMWMAQIMGGFHFSIARHWQPLMTSILCWPIIYYCLHKWRI